MRIIICSFLLLILTASVAAQENSSPSKTAEPKPADNNSRNRAKQNQQAALERQREAELELKRQQSYQRLMNLGGDPISIPSRVRIYRDVISQYYRKPNKKELAAVRPSEIDLKKYASFLKAKNTGIVKLIPDAGCAINTKVLVVSEECRKYSMPGGGSSFSFRTETYRISRLSDLTFKGDGLISMGSLLEAVFVSLGDIPIEKVSLTTEGIEFLYSMKPSKTVEQANDLAEDLAGGAKRNGVAYGRGVLPKKNTTFALRSIAFRGKWMNAAAGVTYNEFDFDKRRDLIVAFRIVRKGDDGSITLIWKELSNRRSPKLKIKAEKKK